MVIKNHLDNLKKIQTKKQIKQEYNLILNKKKKENDEAECFDFNEAS